MTLGFTATLNVTMQVSTLQETVTVTGDTPVVDVSSTKTLDQLRLQGARLDPERARHVGDPRRVAGGDDGPHRRRRQRRGHAERLPHLRRARRSEPRDDRRARDHRRHRRDRRLRRLRRVRGSHRRHRRTRRRHGPARRADADDDQVGRQPVPRLGLRRLSELEPAIDQHHRRAGRARHPRQGSQPDEGLLRLQRRRRRLRAEGQDVVVRLVPRVRHRDQRAALPGARRTRPSCATSAARRRSRCRATTRSSARSCGR